MVRALASHQCGPGSNPGVDAICGLSLLLVLSFAPRGFSPGTPVFPSPQKTKFPNSSSIRNQVRGKFRIRKIRRNVLLKFLEVCVETPCWCPPGWAPTWRTKTMRNISYRVLLQKHEFIRRGTHKHYSNTFYHTF